jgi:hypothetical protein
MKSIAITKAICQFPYDTLGLGVLRANSRHIFRSRQRLEMIHHRPYPLKSVGRETNGQRGPEGPYEIESRRSGWRAGERGRVGSAWRLASSVMGRTRGRGEHGREVLLNGIRGWAGHMWMIAQWGAGWNGCIRGDTRRRRCWGGPTALKFFYGLYSNRLAKSSLSQV